MLITVLLLIFEIKGLSPLICSQACAYFCIISIIVWHSFSVILVCYHTICKKIWAMTFLHMPTSHLGEHDIFGG
jgi:hypothetical protein